jgi:hypothetical protein
MNIHIYKEKKSRNSFKISKIKDGMENLREKIRKLRMNKKKGK